MKPFINKTFDLFTLETQEQKQLHTKLDDLISPTHTINPIQTDPTIHCWLERHQGLEGAWLNSIAVEEEVWSTRVLDDEAPTLEAFFEAASHGESQ